MQKAGPSNRHRGQRVWLGMTCAGIAWGLFVAALATSASSVQDKPAVKTDFCANAGCHAGIVNRKVMHDPAAQAKCLDCHEYAVPKDHLFRLTTPKRELCNSCHTLRLGATVHEPVAERDCTGCHDPHGSEHPLMLVEDPAGGLCRTCHEQDFSDKEYVHGPVAVGACIVCHEPHSSPYEGLLTTGPKELCLTCHSEVIPEGLAARHLHKPMEEGCTTCHDPHASDIRLQLRASNPILCLSCHKGVKNLLDSAAVVHGPMGDDAGCTSCHGPHFTQLPRLQKLPQPDACLNCHNEPIETSDGRTLMDMAALLRDNPNHHGPIREGACTACHQPHASDRFSLLFEEYPAQFYAPFKVEQYALCFSCHMADLVLDESGTGLTGFRNGDLNLHWLHVNQEKGRTCRACHEVHASKRPFHIREAVPFGSKDWMLQINYEQSAGGGTCSPACHKTRRYSRSGPEEPAGREAISDKGSES